MKTRKLLESFVALALVATIMPQSSSAFGFNSDTGIGLTGNTHTQTRLNTEVKFEYKDYNQRNTKLRISDIDVVESSSYVKISWETNIPSSGEVRYNTLGSIKKGKVVTDGSVSSSHEITLTGLTPNTRYYYRIVAESEDNQTRQSPVLLFRTDGDTKDTDDPRLIMVMSVGIRENSARIIWLTNEPSDSKVWLSTGSSVDTNTTPYAESSKLSFYHSVLLKNLSEDTDYKFRVGSTDGSGNTTISGTESFETN